MPLIEREIVVPASVEDTFGFVANFESCAEWDPGVSAASRRDDTPAGVGAVYEVDVDFNGRHLPMVYRTIVWDEPNRVVLEGSGSTVKATDDISFEAVGEGQTRITYKANIRMRGFLAIVTPLLGKRFQAIGDAAMSGMQEAFARR